MNEVHPQAFWLASRATQATQPTQPVHHGVLRLFAAYELVSTLTASALSRLKDVLEGISSITDPRSLESAKTPQDVLAYAYSIRHREPSFAADLIAAVNREEQ